MSTLVIGPDGTPKMCPSHRLVFDALLARHANGAQDLTDTELQEVLERLHAPRRFDRAWIAGRVSEMKRAGLLLESQAHRYSDAGPRGDGAVKVRATYVPPAFRGGHSGRVIASAVAAVECY